MRFMLKASFPVEAGNADARNGYQAIRQILEEQKPEAAYFIAEGGRRTAVLIVNMDDLSQMPALAEPWFLALNASIDLVPVMVPEDLAKAGPDVQRAVETFGGSAG